MCYVSSLLQNVKQGLCSDHLVKLEPLDTDVYNLLKSHRCSCETDLSLPNKMETSCGVRLDKNISYLIEDDKVEVRNNTIKILMHQDDINQYQYEWWLWCLMTHHQAGCTEGRLETRRGNESIQGLAENVRFICINSTWNPLKKIWEGHNWR